MIWDRTPRSKVPGVTDEDDTFDRPGDVRSLPRDGKPRDVEHPEMIWDRSPRAMPDADWSADKPEYDWTGARPDELMAKPRPGEGTETESPDDAEQPLYDWSADKPSDTEYSGAAPDYDWSGNEPGAPDYDWSSNKPDDVDWNKSRPLYDWAGARPEKLMAVPKPGDGAEAERPEYDWSADRPDDAVWKKEEPNYDWSGARPEEPFDRPRDVAMGALYEEGPDDFDRISDDLSEYTEDDDDRPKPVTGVPCAAWTMLALGVAAGGAAAVSGPAAGIAQPPLTQEAGVDPNAGAATDAFFPDPSGLLPCVNDPTCQMIMDGLGPVIPPGTMALFDIPGTCQSKSRDWLRTNKDVLEFNAERIRQRYAFTMFFCETDGGDWLENDMWLSDLHECDWYNRIGLDPCNRVETIEMVRIHDNGLQGTLPSELSILSSLYEFTISDNLVSGTFPSDYAALSELDTFCIAFNQFEGPVPGFIFRFPDMVYLDIAYNRFTGTLPQDIPQRMPDLRIFFMENNDIGGTIPANLGDLNLRRVHMDDNALTGTIPTQLGNPPRLQQLYLHGNQLTGTIPSEFKNLDVLNSATFHYNSLEGTVDNDVCELYFQKQLSTISVDCESVVCDCCVCGEPDI